MDAVVEPSWMSLWRVTGMTVLNHLLPLLSRKRAAKEFNEPSIVKFAECTLVERHTDYWIVGWIKHWHLSDR